jgi:hypothetical protein
MTTHRLRTGTLAAATAVLLVACGAAPEAPVTEPAPTTSLAATPTPQASAPRPLVDDLLAARVQGEPQRFAALVSQAATSCADADAARTLGQLSAVATRWAESVTSARPKAQARTEAQLAAVDWAALISTCST